MKTGIRFTCLKNGDNLLGQNWEYKGKTGVEAIQEKLNTMFYLVDDLSIDYIIDTLYIGKGSANDLYLPNTGINGDLWPVIERLQQYQQLSSKYNKKILIELEFPTDVTEYNYQQYAQYAVDVIGKFPFISYWQIMTTPEEINKVTNEYKCPPGLYVQIIKYIADIVHTNLKNVKIGGPGSFDAINEYVNSAYKNSDKQVFHTGWLAEATGELYGTNTKYDNTEKAGILPYIDFFSFQGDTSTGKFTYDTLYFVVQKLKTGLVEQANRSGISFNVPFLSTKQGHMADIKSKNDLELQAYRDLKEYMVDFVSEVIPFKTQLVDEYFDEKDKNTIKNVYGILYYYMNKAQKPAYQQFQFVLNKLSEYNSILKDEMMIKAKRPYDELEGDVQSVMFINDKQDKVLTVIYPVAERNTLPGNTSFSTVTLTPALNRIVYLPNGNSVTITNPTDVNFKNYDFIIVEENVVIDTVDKEDLQQTLDLKLNFYNTYIKRLLDMVPDDYNKEVYDTNFYNLIRAVGIEFGDMRYEMKMLQDNYYLSTAHGDAIYNNFGAIIGVRWKKKWSEEQYRTAVSGIIDALFHGANKPSMEKAIKAYTGYDVKIYELFEDYAHYGIPKELNWDNQYRFTVEVQKNIDDETDISDAYEDVKEAVDLTKPAHTLPIIMIVLVGEENYRDWYKQKYGIDFSQSDINENELMKFSESNRYGWKSLGYDWVLETDSDHFKKINDVFPIAPRYTLYDRYTLDYLQKFKQNVPKPKDELYAELISWYQDEYDRTVLDTMKALIEMEFKEAKYGIKPTATELTLKTNGGLQYDKDGNIIGCEKRKTMSHRYGFRYALYDDMWLLYEYFGEEKYLIVKDAEMSAELIKKIYEKFHKPIEKYNAHLESSYYELKFGLVPNSPYTLMTYKLNPRNRTNRRLNKHRYAVKNRLLDEVTDVILDNIETINHPTIISSISDKKTLSEKVSITPTDSISLNYTPDVFSEVPYKTPSETCDIELFKVDSFGTKTVIKTESM